MPKVWLDWIQGEREAASRGLGASRRPDPEDRRRSRNAPLGARRARAFWPTRKDAKLRAQFLALTLGALGLVAAEDQRFELVLAFLADVFKNRHDGHSRATDSVPIRINLCELRKLEQYPSDSTGRVQNRFLEINLPARDESSDREAAHSCPRFPAASWLRGGHVQTLAAFFLPRRIDLPAAERRLIEVEPGVPCSAIVTGKTDRSRR
jgi:hypothetical protein